uniref:Uncharacterized protein n=1 Tax=candidate division WOR-3 bacterium TaxID=2052148 RepID=A0A7C6EB04_UNCW3
MKLLPANRRLLKAIILGIVYFSGCGIKPVTKPGWLALSPGTLVLTDQNYFAIVYSSDVSFSDAIERGKNELAAKVYNTVTEYLSRLAVPSDDEVNATVCDALAKRIKETADALRPYIEVKEKFQERRPKKFYVLSGIAAEQIFSQITKTLEGFYEPDYLLKTLQEAGDIYRVKVATKYDQEITPKLVENGCLIDNGRYYASVIGNAAIVSQSTLKSLSGPLWTVKGQYIITIKGKKGDVLGRFNGTIGTGVANSKTEALDKAVASSSVDLANFGQYIPSIKSSIETYLKERINKLLKQSDEPTRLNYASALQSFEAKDYQNTTIYLERCSIYSKNFPQAIILYLRAKGKLGSIGISNL